MHLYMWERSIQSHLNKICVYEIFIFNITFLMVPFSIGPGVTSSKNCKWILFVMDPIHDYENKSVKLILRLEWINVL